MKLSLILNVYNEADVLPYLDIVLKHIDEAIITEGSPIGLSTDGTGDIIKEYQKQYPIKFFQGTFVREDGGYAQAEAKNRMLEEVTNDYIMLHHADIIYNEEDIIRLIDAVNRFPQKTVYYCSMREFFYDMNHIRLYFNAREAQLYRSIVGDVPVFARRLKPIYRNYPLIGLHFEGEWNIYDNLFLPDVKRYHLCFVRPYHHQVEKHVRRITQREWGDYGECLLKAGFETILEVAIEHVDDYAKDPSMWDYCGDYPEVLHGRRMCAMDGRDEFHDNIDRYKDRLYQYYSPCKGAKDGD